MTQTVLRQDTADLMSKIAALYEYFQVKGDAKSAERARDLAVKLSKEEYSIAFCGHFSAGKSSMINKLIGEDILPSSPIPTSANLVKIKHGEDYAKIFYKIEKPKIYRAPYNYEKIKTYCQDGDQINSIEISYSNTKLPNGVIIMDTPGIDSTDDAHRIVTESALHLADFVFYVMDYNHVQSELNFLFTKELQAAGKEVYLIINQIDKHRDDELSFSQFKESVQSSFSSWGVFPARIFYTSLKNELLEENEFSTLQQFIAEKLENRQKLLPESIFQSLKKLAAEHFVYLEEKDWNKISEFEATLAELSIDEHELLFEKKNVLEKELKDIEDKQKTIEKQIIDRIDDVLKNAYLMPFQTRDLAKAYIESRQKGFKIGLLFSKQKTEDERNARLQLLYDDLMEKVKSQIEWHVRELFLQILKEYDIHDATLLAAIQGYQYRFEKELLAELMKEGALLTGDYVLNYTNEIADSIKKLVKVSTHHLREQSWLAIRAKNEAKINRIGTESGQLSVYVEAYQGIKAIKDNLQLFRNEIEKLLNGEFQKEKYNEKLDELLAEDLNEAEIMDELKEPIASNHLEKSSEMKVELISEAKSEKVTKEKTKALIETIQFTANALSDVPGFKKMATELMQKAEKLAQKQFTVALFGAFSAGKSSFANALIGDKVLPVSPNPTTAAINKIMPTTETYPHGTVVVKVKESEILFADVNHSLKIFNQTATDFNDAMIKIDKVMKSKVDFEANEKTHFAFLHAFKLGFEFFSGLLGKTVMTDLPQLKDYVAIEEKSCFVNTIEVYYDCELTRKGITLVDTPGADSINARHTGVAFDYIKNSDAILFVTYYNHAFSKADREFLIQLGRVKEAFEMDKMFFIVNAIDLANNEEEEQVVMEYVSEQLIQYGIRKPNLFGVSSLAALAEKLEKREVRTSQIHLFEDRFYSFISNDLMEISISASQMEWQRVLAQLRKFIQSSLEDKDLKREKRNQLESEQKALLQSIENQTSKILSQRLTQEVDELVFYLMQRVFLRHHDFVKEAFNPAILKDDGRNLKKALQAALDEYLQSNGFDFVQELRATTIRLEAFIGKLLADAQDLIKNSAMDLNPQLSFSRYEMGKSKGIEFEHAFLNLDLAQFKKALAYFKNPKTFFEKNERRFLSEELQQVMRVLVEPYLQAETIRLKEHYGLHLQAEFSHLLSNQIEQVNEYYAGLLTVLSDDFSLEQLKKIEHEISSNRGGYVS